jgi:hypothetical protein
MAAGTVTITYSTSKLNPDAGIRTITLDWLSSSGGAVNGNLTEVITGELLRVIFLPNTGATQPTDQYDMTILDSFGLDILAGQGANLSNANKSHVCPGVPMKDGTTTATLPVALHGTLDLNITNAGNAKTGQVVLCVR